MHSLPAVLGIEAMPPPMDLGVVEPRELGLPRPIVGLRWSGNMSYRQERAIDEEAIERGLAPGVAYVSLHENLRPRSGRVVDLSDSLRTMRDTASVIRGCDLVVTVDTSVAHLSGSLGAPTVVLVPKRPAWPWMADGERTPLYPSVRVMRQREDEDDWAPTMDRLRTYLLAPGKGIY